MKTYTYTSTAQDIIDEFDTETTFHRFIPVSSGNRDYLLLVATGTVINPAPFIDPSIDFKNKILSVVNPDPFAGVSGTVVVSGGLSLVTNVPNLIANDVTVVTPHPSFTKNVLISIVYNTDSDTFQVAAREKTTDIFAELSEEEINVKDLGEFFVTAGGSTLLPV